MPGAEPVRSTLEPEEDGYFSGLVAAAGAGTLYRYRLDGALERYAAFSQRHAPAYAWALALQRTLPRLPPRALTALLSVMGRERPCRRAFNWYLALAPPAHASNR